MPTSENPWGLTDRQVAVLEKLANGLTYKQIGQELGGITVSTVRTHSHEAYRKMNVPNANAAVAKWIREVEFGAS